MPQLAPPSCRTVMCFGGAFCRILRVDATPKPRALLPLPRIARRDVALVLLSFKKKNVPPRRAAARTASMQGPGGRRCNTLRTPERHTSRTSSLACSLSLRRVSARAQHDAGRQVVDRPHSWHELSGALGVSSTMYDCALTTCALRSELSLHAQNLSEPLSRSKHDFCAHVKVVYASS